jgi:hypothetical protein
MSYLYKRSNRLWHLLIKHELTHLVWRPLVELTRRRHVRFRGRLERRTTAPLATRAEGKPRDGHSWALTPNAGTL